jgi:hypothetical protein
VAKTDDNKRDKWLKRLSDEDKAHAEWRKRAKEADKAYCNYEGGADPPKAPLFPATINIIHGKIYAQPPKPDVRKRHQSGAYSAQSPAVSSQPAATPVQPQAVGQQLPGPAPVAAGAGANPAQAAQSSPAMGMAPPPVADPIADENIIALAIEGCLKYIIDSTLFADDGHAAVNDFLVTGLGDAKVEMETRVEAEPIINPATGNVITDPETGETLTKDVITFQTLHLRHFSYSQFRWEPAKDWRRCSWVAFDHYLTKDEIEAKFGVDLDPKGDKSTEGDSNQRENGQATGTSPPQMDKYEGVYTVHEIWDKRKRERLFVTDAYDDVLLEEDDPLELEDFFPCPRPMMALQNGREMVPCPEYWQCAHLFDQLTEIADRIWHITRQIKDIGFYDDSFVDLQKLNLYEDGAIIPVKNLLDKLRSVDGKATAESVLFQVDMGSKVNVLTELLQQYATVKQRIDEWWGIADIEQGTSNPEETATAQTIKDNWANIRTGQRVQKVAMFFRDVLRIMAELIANKFDAAQIKAMCGIALSEEQLELMRSDLAREYVIDVQSDSTMLENDAQDVQDLTQFMGAFTPWLREMLPAVKQGILPADLAKEITSLFIDTYKPGRNLQQAIEALPSTLDQINQLTMSLQQAQQQAQQAQQQLQQYQAGEEARKNAQTQADVAKKQVDTEAAAQKLQPDAIKAAAEASQASRQDIIDGAMTGIH